jgi:hypothetical protein
MSYIDVWIEISEIWEQFKLSKTPHIEYNVVSESQFMHPLRKHYQ